MGKQSRLRCFALSVLLAFMLSVIACGQEAQNSNNIVKVAEFVIINGCQLSAIMDVFVTELVKNPESVGYIVAYRPPGESKRLALTLFQFKGYLRARGLDVSRVKLVDGGKPREGHEKSTMSFELLVAPQGAEMPGKELGLFEGHLATLEYPYLDAGTSIITSPQLGIDEALREQPEAKIYLVAKMKRDSLPHQTKEALRETAQSMAANKIAPERIKTVFGGYLPEPGLHKKGNAPSIEIEYWVLPADAPPPVSKAKYLPLPSDRPILISKDEYYSAVSAEDSEIVAGRVKELVRYMRRNPKAKICLILRYAAPDLADYDEGETAKLVDLARIAGYWRSILLKKHNIGPERLAILPATAKAGGHSSIAVYFVPAGVSLPDPKAFEEVEDPATEDP